MDKLLAKFLLLVIIFYQRLISPWLAPRCRFYPTCSSYGLEAVRLHGGYRGGLLTAKRIARCRSRRRSRSAQERQAHRVVLLHRGDGGAARRLHL